MLLWNVNPGVTCVVFSLFLHTCTPCDHLSGQCIIETLSPGDKTIETWVSLGFIPHYYRAGNKHDCTCVTREI